MVAAIALGSVASGTVYWLLGRLRLGSVVRFIPYPVIGGFLAATGWIFVAGGIAVCASQRTPMASRLGSPRVLW